MLEKVFCTQELLVADRVDAWCDITARALVPNEFSIDRPAEFRASLRAVALGQAHVSAMAYTRMRSRRTPRLIRRSDPEMYAVGLVLGGDQMIEQNRRALPLGPGDLVVYSTSHPFETGVDVDEDVATSVVVQFPRSMVPLPPDRVDRMLAARLPGRSGPGGLLAGFLSHLAADTGRYGRSDGLRLGGVLVDLVTAWLAHHIEAADQLPTETRQHVQFLEIKDFIRRHLGEGELTPVAVAAAHHISVRTLHRLFRDQAHGVTVAAYIRRQRLAHARRDLADPRLSARTIYAIAARWGFFQPADFSRAFRTAYGTTPSEYRQSVLRFSHPGVPC